MGAQILADSCFDLVKASGFFDKLASMPESDGAVWVCCGPLQWSCSNNLPIQENDWCFFSADFDASASCTSREEVARRTYLLPHLCL